MHPAFKWLYRNWIDRLYLLIVALLVLGAWDRWLPWPHHVLMWGVLAVLVLHTALMTSAWGRKNLYGKT